MGPVVPFMEADPVRDRAVGLVWGAACGARVSQEPASAWPTAQDMLVQVGGSLVECRRLSVDDVLRRLIRAWSQRAGRPAVVQGLCGTTHASTAGFVAGLAPICIHRRHDRKAAQAEVADLAMQFAAGAAGGEALELVSMYMRLVLLGQDRRQALAPLDWEGDARVARVAAGQSLPLNTRRDLVAAVDQARALALRCVSLETAFAALATVGAAKAAFILTGALIGALDGQSAFAIDPQADRAYTPSAELERLVDDLLALDHRPEPGKTSSWPS